MFARILEFEIKIEKKDEFFRTFKNEVLPILKKAPGFLEVLPFTPEKMHDKKIFTISLWENRMNAEKYEKEWYPKAYDFLKPFITSPVTVNFYNVETTVCEHFVNMLAA